MTEETTDKKPRVSLTDSPEFKAAVAEAVAKAAPAIVAAAVAQVAKQNPEGPIAPLAGTTEFFENMSQTIAMAVAEISDQGTNRKRVAPEVLARREAAGKRARELVVNARLSGLKPEYRVVSKINFNERLIEPFRRLPDKTVVAQEITWTGMPNEALRPLNAIAKEIFSAYKESIGSTEKIATVDNRDVWVTPAGLVVKGDAPAKAFVAPRIDADDDLGVRGDVMDNNDPNAPEIHILGTIAAPARRNFADPAQAMADRLK
jgi:hypothetical protein